MKVHIYRIFPLLCLSFGEYDDYGGVENIEKNENTKFIADYFGVSIDKFVELLLNGENTYDRDEVKPIKKKIKHADEIKDWTFMFIDRDVYDFMSTHAPNGYDGKGDLEFGNPKILELLGFEYVGENTKNKTSDPKRYKHEWKFGDKLFHGDGTWLHYGKQGINYLEDFKGIIELPEEVQYLKDKSMWDLWEQMDKVKVSQSLFWILGERRFEYGLESLEERIAEICGTKYVRPAPKNIAEKYIAEYLTFGKWMKDLVSIRHNLSCMSGYFQPYVLYLTPQCGEHADHQVLLEKFAEINRKQVYQEEE